MPINLTPASGSLVFGNSAGNAPNVDSFKISKLKVATANTQLSGSV